ncbi:transposable element Tcb1 transposase [Trichonephila clavipes]|nr:transposable element Tcb1 transposase [Trichonephila clavipes]
MQKGSLIRRQLYEELEKLIVSTVRRCLKLSYNYLSRHTCFYYFQKTNGRLERWRAVGCIEAGHSITDVALFFSVHHSVISRLWKQFQTTQTVVRRPVGGCPRVTTPKEDRYIAIVAKWNRRATSTRVTSRVTESIGKAISAATVRRRLHMNGLYARVPRDCVPLSVQSREARLKWCWKNGYRTVSDWGNVMFTDELRFTLESDDKRIRIWRYRIDLHILKRVSVTAVRYRDEVLEPIVRLYAAAVGPTFVLMDDNAHPHRADIVDDYLESEVIARMAWPTYSPDPNPIQNLWDALGRAVSSRFPPPATLIELETALQEECRLLNSAVVDHLIESMVRRCPIYERKVKGMLIETSSRQPVRGTVVLLENSITVWITVQDGGDPPATLRTEFH